MYPLGSRAQIRFVNHKESWSKHAQTTGASQTSRFKCTYNPFLLLTDRYISLSLTLGRISLIYFTVIYEMTFLKYEATWCLDLVALEKVVGILRIFPSHRQK